MEGLDKLSIIKLGDDREYVVAELLDYNDTNYAYLIGVDADEELTEEYRIVKIGTGENGKMGIEDITDENELSEVKEVLIPLVELNYAD